MGTSEDSAVVNKVRIHQQAQSLLSYSPVIQTHYATGAMAVLE